MATTKWDDPPSIPWNLGLKTRPYIYIYGRYLQSMGSFLRAIDIIGISMGCEEDINPQIAGCCKVSSP